MPFPATLTTIPDRLRTDEFVLRPIVADDAERDYAALMETRQLLRLWQQSSWPEGDFTVAANRADLLDMQQRHEARLAYSYTVLEPAGHRPAAPTTAPSDPGGDECLGCVYVFPTDASFLRKATVTPLTDARWADVDAVVYFWVRLSRLETGMDGRLLAALRSWFTDEWGFRRTGYVVSEQFTEQLELFRQTDLTPEFTFTEPDKAGTFLVFG